MPVTVLMPALSPTMEKGKLSKWLKSPGDKISSGDVLAEIETDKATMEVEAVDEGILGEILVAEGTDDVAVNTPIALILAEGEKAGASAPKAAPKPVEKAASAATAPAATSPSLGAVSSGAPSSASPTASGARLFASPLARRVGRDKGIDLARLQGSGPHGRIVLRDVEAAPAASAATGLRPAAQGLPNAPVLAVPSALALAPADAAVLKVFEEGSYDLVPHDGMRKIIARRLVESKQLVPHFYLSADVSLEHLLPLRERLNAQAPKAKDGTVAWKISVNDFIIKALAMALMKVPAANVSWTEGAMVHHHHADVGVAVSIAGGLMTPIVRKAETKGLAEISNEMKDLAARARTRRLAPQEYQGGSTSVSNLGMMGVKSFSAIINPPQSTILAVGAAERRAVVRGSAIVIEQQMSVTLSTDHRCVDGALGAELLAALKAFLEEPGLMLT